MGQGDLGLALRGPLGGLEAMLREHMERHRTQEAEAVRGAMVMMAKELSAAHEEQMRKQAEILAFSEQRAEAKLKAARRAAQTRLQTACASLERQCEARLAEAAQ